MVRTVSPSRVIDPGQAGPLGQDLDVGPRVADGGHDHLDQAGPLAGDGVDDDRAGVRPSSRRRPASACSVSPSPIWRASA